MPLNRRTIFCLTIAAFWPVTALAYIDPGTGSILIQGIIAAIAALAVSLKLYWHRFIAFFRRKPVQTVTADESLQEKTESEQAKSES